MTIAERVARIFKECEGVWGQSGISSWERERLEEWRGRQTLSEKQEAILRQIEKKAFPEEHDADREMLGGDAGHFDGEIGNK